MMGVNDILSVSDVPSKEKHILCPDSLLRNVQDLLWFDWL